MGHQVDVDYFEAVKRKDITDRHEGYHYVLKKKKNIIQTIVTGIFQLNYKVLMVTIFRSPLFYC